MQIAVQSVPEPIMVPAAKAQPADVGLYGLIVLALFLAVPRGRN